MLTMLLGRFFFRVAEQAVMKVEIRSLKEIYEPYFNIGVAVSTHTIETRSELIKKHFNSIVCENEMKYGSLCNEKGDYTFDDADQIVEFVREHHMILHGHALVWHNQTPNYIFEKYDAEGLMGELENHIIKLRERYSGLLRSMDVVNEAIEDKADKFLRDSRWMEKLGDDYIAKVFRLTKKLLPDTALYYNDYNECNPVKREKILRLVKELLDQGVPIDGIGLQSHHNLFTPTIDEIKRSIEAYAELGLQLRISELDVSMFAFEDETKLDAPSDEMLEKQADYYEGLFTIYKEYYKHIDTVTLWGGSDADSWLNHFPVINRKNWPLLFDANGEPKEAYYRIANL